MNRDRMIRSIWGRSGRSKTGKNLGIVAVGDSDPGVYWPKSVKMAPMPSPPKTAQVSSKKQTGIKKKTKKS